MPAILSKRFHCISYEELHHQTSSELEQLRQFIGLQLPFPVPEVKSTSLDRWKADLNSREIADIDAILEEKDETPLSRLD